MKSIFFALLALQATCFQFEYRSIQIITAPQESPAEQCVKDAYYIYQDVKDLAELTDPTEIIQKVLDALQKGFDGYSVCLSVDSDELLKALEAHANKEGVDCLESTLKYSNEL